MDTKNGNITSLNERNFIAKHPIIANLLIIAVVAFIGLCIAYFSLALFTKHGEYSIVPSVEKMSYSDAISKLHSDGFKIEVSDSVFREDIRPGYVIEQNPAADSKVKPGRVVYLVINAVHPKQVSVSNLQGISLRQGKSMLEGLGFKNIKVVFKLGKHKDLIQRVTVKGRPVRNGEKIAVNAQIVLEVSDGRVDELTDSLLNAEYGFEENPEFIDESQLEYINPYENTESSGEQTEENTNPYNEEIEEHSGLLE